MRCFFACLLSLLCLACPGLRAQKTPAPSPEEDACVADTLECRRCFAGDYEQCLGLVSRYQDAAEAPRDLKRAALFWMRAAPSLEARCQAAFADACVLLGQQKWRSPLIPRDPQGARRDFERAAIIYQRGCAEADPAACIRLAQLYQQEGSLSLRDVAPLYEEALRLGEGAAWILLRELRVSSQKYPLNPTEQAPTSSPLFEESCAQGDLPRCQTLAALYEAAGDLPKAEAIWRRSCEANVASACYLVAHALLARGDASAEVYADKSCAAGLLRGCHLMFALSLQREPAPFQEAQQHWWQRCAWGSTPECNLLLRVYEDKTFLRQPRLTDPMTVYKTRVAIYQTECEAGLGRSCLAWAGAIMYAEPYLATSARQYAAVVFTKGCAQGDGEDCFLAASLYIPREQESALDLMKRGCRLGSQQACVYLYSSYANGVGLPKNQAQSAYFSCMACRLRAFGECPELCEDPQGW